MSTIPPLDITNAPRIDMGPDWVITSAPNVTATLTAAIPAPASVVPAGIRLDDYADFRILVLPFEERSLDTSYGYSQGYRGPNNPLSLNPDEVVLQTLQMPCVVRIPTPQPPTNYGSTGTPYPPPSPPPPTTLVVPQLALVVARRVNHPYLALRERLQQQIHELESFSGLLAQLRTERAVLQQQVDALRAAIPQDRLAEIDLALRAKKETP